MVWLLPWEESNDVKHAHWALYSLLALNIGIFLLMRFGDAATAAAWYHDCSLDPADPHWYQYVTGNFLHAGWMHLVGNMVFLYLFGDNVEDVLGPLGFLLLYFAGGLLGDLMWISSNPSLTVPSLGASGCIATVAGAYAVLFAHQPCSMRVMVVVIPVMRIDLKAIWLLLYWFGADVALTVVTRGHMLDAPGVNFVAHGVGFFVGLAFALFARVHGVMRRYELMPCGHALFGYWPSDMEAAFKREQRLRALREGRADQVRTPTI